MSRPSPRSWPSAWASLAGLVAAAAASVGANAQTCGRLTGEWRLDRAASQMGAGLSFDRTYAVDAIDLSLVQAGDGSVTETWRMEGPHVHEVDSFTIKPDGVLNPTHVKSVVNSTPAAIKAQWLNCTLTLDALTYLFGQEIWTKNSYLLDDGGRRLTIVQTATSDVGDVDRRLVFTKRESSK